MNKFNDWLRRGLNEDEAPRPSFQEDSHQQKSKTEGMLASRPYQNVVVYEPRDNRDIQNLIDFLKRREPAIVNLNQADVATAQRMLDFISGAVYALNGRVHNVSAKIYLLTPDGVNITIPD